MEATGQRHVVIGIPNQQFLFEGSYDECVTWLDELSAGGLFIQDNAKPTMAIMAPCALVSFKQERKTVLTPIGKKRK